jgi:hypothetical protein
MFVADNPAASSPSRTASCAEAVVLQPHVEVDAIDPDMDVVSVGKAPLLERAVLRHTIEMPCATYALRL